MTHDSALARELADRLAILIGPQVHQKNSGGFIDGKMGDELIALLRKWPEPDKDAARYRWLRTYRGTGVLVLDGIGYEECQEELNDTKLDAAIDAAMTASPQEER